MLSLSIKARIPILRAHTSDLLNLHDVLLHLAPGMTVAEMKGGSISSKHQLVYAVDEFVPTQAHYDALVDDGRVLLLVNQGEESHFAFNVGEVPVPKSLMEDLLGQVVKPSTVPLLLPCFNGLTLKGMSEVIRLTTARDKSLTARGVTQIRAMLTGKVQGLGQVDTSLPLYICPPKMQAWVALNKPYFLESKDERLVPRGILLNGVPGVGKTMSAKYIASEFGVTLYRLDLSSALSKWQGVSENQFARVLATLDQETSACLLIDECEKVFAETEDEGVTSRLLSQLLWWLAERRSRVLTIMTTNNMDALPKELYRPGRVDLTMTISRPTPKEAQILATAALQQFLPKPTPKHRSELAKWLKSRPRASSRADSGLSHAEIVYAVVELVKTRGWITI